MQDKTSDHVSSPTILLLKFLYYYAKVLSLVNVKITSRCRFENSKKLLLFITLLRIVGLILLTLFCPEIYDQAKKVQEWHFQAIMMFQLLIVFMLGFNFIATAANCEKLVRIMNGGMDIIAQISRITKSSRIFGPDFYVLVSVRLMCGSYVAVSAVTKFFFAMLRKDYIICAQMFTVYIFLLGFQVMTDIACLGYWLWGSMYRQIGNYMVSLADRIEQSETCSMSKFRRMQELCDFADELELVILCQLYANVVWINGYIHYIFINYFTNGFLIWNSFLLCIARMADILILVWVVDLTLRRSRMVTFVNWDSLCSDIDSRWDRSVDYFVNQLRFQELKFEVCGLFVLSNEFCLEVFSNVVAYLTIIIQFSMMEQTANKLFAEDKQILKSVYEINE